MVLYVVLYVLYVIVLCLATCTGYKDESNDREHFMCKNALLYVLKCIVLSVNTSCFIHKYKYNNLIKQTNRQNSAIVNLSSDVIWYVSLRVLAIKLEIELFYKILNSTGNLWLTDLFWNLWIYRSRHAIFVSTVTYGHILKVLESVVTLTGIIFGFLLTWICLFEKVYLCQNVKLAHWQFLSVNKIYMCLLPHWC